ncbi:hypothetical protein P175DRAFT_0492102 [Aspergillus ochraceoroseus IBT 24754]|uniref:BZIP domain-containing protein n=1 Tax=Aspergillus ochraceoroseus IBT 24754 TaxID=1392256 RepID=A0A2T5LYT3_9EURO|nr:uncharacterized protein P175DRAFT_0492102 [Aspergillus ochraceoroseus IBT 24754]PTU21433.1 hypothetical protein P175DRAFT_0492102 [Aspergillus ochraceoroseus IBT 24754]
MPVELFSNNANIIMPASRKNTDEELQSESNHKAQRACQQQKMELIKGKATELEAQERQKVYLEEERKKLEAQERKKVYLEEERKKLEKTNACYKEQIQQLGISIQQLEADNAHLLQENQILEEVNKLSYSAG